MILYIEKLNDVTRKILELIKQYSRAEGYKINTQKSLAFLNTAAATAAAKSLQSCLTLCDHIDGSPPGSSVPGILQARTRVGCHFLLQCMKVKSESEVTQSCPTLSDPMDCSLPSFSVHGIFQARVLEWGAIAFSELMYNTMLSYWCAGKD